MNTIIEGRPRVRVAIVLGLAALWTGCGKPAPEQKLASGQERSTYHTTDAAGAIPLLDRNGQRIAVGATTPYSPEKTCGGCHDVASITEGYHFQQGKGRSNSLITVADNYNPSKPWLLSDGMFGKW